MSFDLPLIRLLQARVPPSSSGGPHRGPCHCHTKQSHAIWRLNRATASRDRHGNSPSADDCQPLRISPRNERGPSLAATLRALPLPFHRRWIRHLAAPRRPRCRRSQQRRPLLGVHRAQSLSGLYGRDHLH
ncbi:hypothetical protein ACHAWF_001138 [Thalassiosira exigua]